MMNKIRELRRASQNNTNNANTQITKFMIEEEKRYSEAQAKVPDFPFLKDQISNLELLFGNISNPFVINKQQIQALKTTTRIIKQTFKHLGCKYKYR